MAHKQIKKIVSPIQGDLGYIKIGVKKYRILEHLKKDRIKVVLLKDGTPGVVTMDDPLPFVLTLHGHLVYEIIK